MRQCITNFIYSYFIRHHLPLRLALRIILSFPNSRPRHGLHSVQYLQHTNSKPGFPELLNHTSQYVLLSGTLYTNLFPHGLDIFNLKYASNHAMTLPFDSKKNSACRWPQFRLKMQKSDMALFSDGA